MSAYDQQQQILADQLRRYQAQAQTQAPQGRMAGRVYVAPNPLEYLAAGLRGVGGMRGEQQTQQAMTDLQAKRQKEMAELLAGFSKDMQGTPYNPGTQGLEEFGRASIPEQAATPSDPMAAFGRLSASQFPEFQKMGMQGQISTAQAQQQRAQLLADEERKRAMALEDAERQRALKAQEQQRMLGILQQTQGNPQAAIAAGVPPEVVKSFYESPNFGRAKVSFQNTGGALVPTNEYGETPQGVAPIPKTAGPANMATDLLIPDPANPGKFIVNQQLAGAKAGIAKAGATTVDARSYNTQESAQSQVYGKSLGEMRATINQAGYDAPAKLARLDRMEQLLAGVDGGAAAPAMAEIASFANSLGVKIDPKLGNKQAAEALAREMAATLRQPGTGPMTDKDFDNFLKQVPSLSKTAEGRTEIIKTLRAAVARDQMAAKFQREYAQKNNGTIDDNFFDVLADFYAKNPVVTPAMPATNSRGQPFADPGKERRYQEYLKRQGGK
jgi:hypothetical protein